MSVWENPSRSPASGINNRSTFKVTQIIFFPHSDAQFDCLDYVCIPEHNELLPYDWLIGYLVNKQFNMYTFVFVCKIN